MPRPAASRIRAAFLGTLVAGAAGVIAAGWILRAPELAELPPDWSPMQANAALGFVALGLGLVLAALGGPFRWLASGLGLATAALGGATLAQYALGNDLGIDQWLVPDWLSPGDPHPGRMAPNSALGLAVAGASLALSRHIPMIAAAMGALAAALGGSALLGYATGIEDAYAWGSLTRMSPATAVGLLVVGAALGLEAGTLHPAGTAIWRGPLAVGLACAVMAVLFSQALAIHQDAQLGLVMDAGAARVRAEIHARLDTRMQALRLLAREWEGRLRRDRDAWAADAELVMAQSPGLVAIEWVSKDGVAEWTHPEGVELPATDLEVLSRHLTVDGAIALPPLRLPGGRAGLRIVVPLRETGGLLGRFRKNGWLAATFDGRELLSEILLSLGRSYEIRVSSGRFLLFAPQDPAPLANAGWERKVDLDFPGGLELAARVRPSGELLAAGSSQLRPLLLAGGLAMSLLLALALGLRNVSSARARALEQEVRGHERAEEEVRRLNAELEERVRQRTDELLRSNDDLRRFAAFLSHELKQPVGAQTIWAELLESRHGQRLDAEGRRYISEIRATAHRTAELISAQLDLFSVTAAELKGERVDLAGVVRALTADLKKPLEAARAQVRVGELPVVRGDSRLLYQLFRNLLENSLKYRRAEVPLEVRIEHRPPQDPAQATFEIVVEDNGLGFPGADAERIFEPSERLGAERDDSHGLGLAVCKRIAERHGGELWASGRPGAGATFHIRLPRALWEAPDPARSA
jgi:signal transduction histidine kinase